MNYTQQELNTVDLEKIDEIYAFCRRHNVEVRLGSDYQYEVWIDESGSYGSWITFFGALYGGINLYNNLVKDEIGRHTK